MKRRFVFVIGLFLLVSCSKRRFVHFEAVMVSNTNIVFFDSQATGDYAYQTRIGHPLNQTPIPVGEIYRGARNINAKKGDNISLSLNALCDSSITTTDTIQCDFEMVIGFFVDDVLIEERIILNSSSEIKQIRWDGSTPDENILLGTIDFTVP